VSEARYATVAFRLALPDKVAWGGEEVARLVREGFIPFAVTERDFLRTIHLWKPT
jgi:hypothetical protein